MRRALVVCAGALVSAPAMADYVAVSWLSGRLWRIDDQTGAATQIGLLGPTFRANSMARSPDGRYYVAAETGDENEWLFEIDPATGQSTQLFQTGIDDVRSMAFGPDGTLYAVQHTGPNASRVWAIDVAGGAATPGVDLGLGAADQGLAIDADGNAFMDGPNVAMHRIDLTTGVVTRYEPFPGNARAQSLTLDLAGGLFGLGTALGADEATLWSYDTATGVPTPVLAVDRQDYRGFEFIVPAPGPLLMLGGCGSLALRRRR